VPQIGKMKFTPILKTPVPSITINDFRIDERPPRVKTDRCSGNEETTIIIKIVRIEINMF